MNMDNLKLDVIKELVLMTLTYRISYQNLSRLLRASEEDIKRAFSKVDQCSSSLYHLEHETKNEDEINARVAYVHGYNYLKERKQLMKKLRIAKEEKNENEIVILSNKLTEHFHLIDDTLAYSTLDKKLYNLTQAEKEAIARFRLKYAYSKNECAKILRRNRNDTFDLLEQELAEHDPIFKEKITFLNDYWEKERLDVISKLPNR